MGTTSRAINKLKGGKNVPTLAKLVTLLGAKKTPIYITEQSGNNLTNYAVKINLTSTWDGWGVVKSDGSDIYILDGSGNPLYYWIEIFDYTNKNATIWAQVPSIPANTTKTIYLYYGAANPYTAYRQPTMFLFYDDFRDGYAHGWSVPPTVVLDGGNYVGRIDVGTTYITNVFPNIDTSTIGVRVEFFYKIVSLGSYGPRASISIRNNSVDAGYAIINEIGSYYNNFYHMGYATRTSYTRLAYNGNSYSTNVWYYNNYLQIYKGSIVGVLGASTTMTATDTRVTVFNILKLETWDSGNVFYIDNIKVRAIVIPEPSVSIGTSISALKDLDLV